MNIQVGFDDNECNLNEQQKEMIQDIAKQQQVAIQNYLMKDADKVLELARRIELVGEERRIITPDELEN